MFKNLLNTTDDAAMLVLRILLGIVFVPHGMQKIMGYSATMESFTSHLGIPAILAFFAIMAEVLGPIGLISGFLTRVAAFAISVNMVVCVYLMHWQNGFFMNWFGNQKGEGYEFHILVITIGLALMIRGGGKWSLDKVIADRI
jgi:putative oxidoreductase